MLNNNNKNFSVTANLADIKKKPGKFSVKQINEAAFNTYKNDKSAFWTTLPEYIQRKAQRNRGKIARNTAGAVTNIGLAALGIAAVSVPVVGGVVAGTLIANKGVKGIIRQAKRKLDKRYGKKILNKLGDQLIEGGLDENAMEQRVANVLEELKIKNADNFVNRLINAKDIEQIIIRLGSEDNVARAGLLELVVRNIGELNKQQHKKTSEIDLYTASLINKKNEVLDFLKNSEENFDKSTYVQALQLQHDMANINAKLISVLDGYTDETGKEHYGLRHQLVTSKLLIDELAKDIYESVTNTKILEMPSVRELNINLDGASFVSPDVNLNSTAITTAAISSPISYGKVVSPHLNKVILSCASKIGDCLKNSITNAGINPIAITVALAVDILASVCENKDDKDKLEAVLTALKQLQDNDSKNDREASLQNMEKILAAMTNIYKKSLEGMQKESDRIKHAIQGNREFTGDNFLTKRFRDVANSVTETVVGVKSADKLPKKAELSDNARQVIVERYEKYMKYYNFCNLYQQLSSNVDAQAQVVTEELEKKIVSMGIKLTQQDQAEGKFISSDLVAENLEIADVKVVDLELDSYLIDSASDEVNLGLTDPEANEVELDSEEIEKQHSLSGRLNNLSSTYNAIRSTGEVADYDKFKVAMTISKDIADNHSAEPDWLQIDKPKPIQGKPDWLDDRDDADNDRPKP